MTALSADDLEEIGSRIAVPSYDRRQVRSGIVHLGVGGFHRAHQAMYVDALIEAQGTDGDAGSWGITGVGLLAQDEAMAEAMRAQDCLYTLVVKQADGSLEPRVIGSIVDYLFAPESGEAVLDRLADPATRIVSLTVTEGGYHVNQATGDFDDSDPDVRADIERLRRGEGLPTTAFGFITAALSRRRREGTEPFTVMSCDNIQRNGTVARDMIGAFATLCDDELGSWVREHVAFPSSMVDRITPGTTDDDRDLLSREFDVQDRWPVVCESFAQWALEDDFPLGRPALEEVGVQVVDDVEPYELMKLRLLNASHQALCYLGYLSGYRYAHEAAQDELFADFLLAYMDREATPTLEEVPGVDLTAYKRELVERFANPEIRDTLARLCAHSSDRIPKWLVPVVSRNLETDGEVRLSALVVAAWARYAEGVDESGDSIEVVDRRKDALTERAERQAEDPLAFLEDRDLFDDLHEQSAFTEPYREALRSLHEDGARSTLEAWTR
jgi:mannitol 2-dehydrogenase